MKTYECIVFFFNHNNRNPRLVHSHICTYAVASMRIDCSINVTHAEYMYVAYRHNGLCLYWRIETWVALFHFGWTFGSEHAVVGRDAIYWFAYRVYTRKLKIVLLLGFIQDCVGIIKSRLLSQSKIINIQNTTKWQFNSQSIYFGLKLTL